MDYLPSLGTPARLYLHLLSSRLQPFTATTKLPSFVEKSPSQILPLLRSFIIILLHAFFFLLRLVYNDFPSASPPSPPTQPGGAAGYLSRALSHVLATITLIPASSRKYELLRALADRLLEDNFLCNSAAAVAINGDALSQAFSRTIRRLHSAAARPASGGLVGGVRSKLSQWVDPAEDHAGEDEDTAEKLAAELLWLSEKMVAAGGAGDAVAAWGGAGGLAKASLSASPKLQAALVKLTVFLLRHTEKGERSAVELAARWLPLLCRGGGGVGGGERAAVVAALEDIIAGMSWGEKEETLALWLHHFAAAPSSDWPDLQPCYARWYAAARGVVAEEEALLVEGKTATVLTGI